MNVIIHEYNNNGVIKSKGEQRLSVAEVLSSIANCQLTDGGYGDLRDKKTRMEIMDICDNCKIGDDIKLEKPHGKLLSMMMEKEHFKFVILSKELIELEEDIINLKD